MPEPNPNFGSLPEEYQQVIRLAQEKFHMTVTPLQLLVGGWSGAVVYLVSVMANESGRVEHCILKLDRKGKASRSDEVTRHSLMMRKADPDFARRHIAELVYERVEQEGAIAIFYRIAGQSLLNFRPLSSYELENQLKTIFAATHTVLLEDWNPQPSFEVIHPQKLLEKWLGFRLDSGGNIEQFLQNVCQVNPDVAGFLIQGAVFPNPLLYARQADAWGSTRPIDSMSGFMHGDLNTNNILARFSADRETLDGYYLIDFALFKEQMPLLYDQRYLEMSYLVHTMAQIPFSKCVALLMRLAEADILEPRQAPIEMSGVAAVIAAGRTAFGAWVDRHHPSLHDDLWGQYWLAGVAAGLSYCHKAGQADEHRLAGLIYASTNLAHFASSFTLPRPKGVEMLYDEGPSPIGSTGSPQVRKVLFSLPPQPTAFIGREAQIAAIRDLLSRPEVHLVTLVGPGGTGKTRLSIQVALEMKDRFAQGVVFVPLAEDREDNQFISRVAQQLLVREGGRPLLENIKDYLSDKSMLLILDNFEQLIPAALVVSEILAAAPQVKTIVSSRVALQLHGEYEFPVPPMDLPEQTGENPVDDLAKNESVHLFVERAGAVKPGFALTQQNASAITEICRRLDGLPLALELAAARIKLLPPLAILTRLDDRLKLLTGGARDLPTRHQTLRNTLQWSYELLTPEERTLFSRLGVFAGGFSLEAAEAICNIDGQLDILEGLSSLVNNSLVRQSTTTDGEARFGMLETIRAYALERLTESHELEIMRQQHARYFSEIVIHQAGPQIYSSKALTWLNWLEQEFDNVRASLARILTSPQVVDLGPELLHSLIWFWYRRGYLSEGRLWANRVLACQPIQDDANAHMLALTSSGLMAIWQGEQEAGLSQLKESLEIGLQQENERFVPFLLFGNGIALLNMGRDSDARPLLEEAQALFKQAHLEYFYVISIVHLGNVELGLENPEKAHTLHEEASRQARALDEPWLLSFALNNLGEVARTQGQYDLARKYYEECEALLKDTGDQGDLARFVHSLGYIAQHEGDFNRAESQFRKSLAMFRRLGNRRGMAECMAGLAGLKARQGQSVWGATLLSAAESALKATGGAWWPADRFEVEKNREIICTSLSEAEQKAAHQKGLAMSLEQALIFASESP